MTCGGTDRTLSARVRLALGQFNLYGRYHDMRLYSYLMLSVRI